MSTLNKKIIEVSKVEMKKSKPNEKPWERIDMWDKENQKYSFFTKKTDGLDTKAFTEFKAQGVTIGSKIGIAFSEEEVTFTVKEGKDAGKEVTYTRRGIAFIADKSALGVAEPLVPTEGAFQSNTPVQPQPPATNEAPPVESESNQPF